MLNSKDLVRRAIEFRNPERVPYNFDSNCTPVIAERYGDDFEWVFSRAPGDAFPRALGNDRYVNEFGEAKEHPLARLENVGAYQLPDFSLANRFAEMEQVVREKPDKYILGMFPHFLFQQMLAKDPARRPQFMGEIVERLESRAASLSWW